jgi:hypothetical protein
MHEAHVLRDGDLSTYNGLSVHKAVATAVNVIGPALNGMNVFDQRGIDETMIALDGTPDKKSSAATRSTRFPSRHFGRRRLRCGSRFTPTSPEETSERCPFLAST